MMKPTVTIGVCVRNCEASIKEAINSIFDQDFPHERMEVIFVDDGSEDRTLSVILDSLSRMDMQVKVFHSKWRGLGPARNSVVDNASGKYIVWVDGDMTLPKDHVRKQVKFMEQNPNVGIAKARYGMLHGENVVATLENIQYIAIDSKYEGKVNPEKLGTGASIYRVEAIRQVGGFDFHIKGAGEDADAESRIRNAGWLLYKGTPALFYERHKKTWKDLWDENFWYGYGGHYILHKNRQTVPFAALSAGLLHSFTAYKITHRKVVFLLPLQHAFKKIAWYFGFVKGKIDGYKHSSV